MTRTTITLQPRDPPLTPVGVVATAAAAGELAASTRRRLRRGADLRAAAGEGWLVVLGAADDLPWAAGCVYLGADGPLLVATTRAVSPSADLVGAALTRSGDGLIVVLEDAILRGPMPVRTADEAQLGAPA